MQLSTLRIAWRNLGRSRKRTGLALLAIGVGQFGLLATQGLMRGYADNIELAVTGPIIGHIQIHEPRWREDRALELAIRECDAIVERIRRDPAVASSAARIYAPCLAAPREDASAAVVIGVDMAEETRPTGLLPALDRPLAPREVLLGYRLARRIEATPGQRIAVVGQAADGSFANDLFTVRDTIRSPADLVNQAGIVMAIEDARALLAMPGQAHEIVVRAHASADVADLAGRLAREPALAGLEVSPWHEIVPEFKIVIDISGYVGYFVLALVVVAAVAGIANTLMMATFERMREFGMLLALGSRPWRLVRLVACEAALLGLLGVLIGTLAGCGFVAWAAQSGIDLGSWGGDSASELAYKGLNLPLEIHPRIAASDPLGGLVAVLLTSLVAALWPASIAARLEPLEALRS